MGRLAHQRSVPISLGERPHRQLSQALLWTDRNNGLGLGNSLAALQEQYELQERGEKNWSPQAEQNLRNLTQALHRMFGDMTLGFRAQSFELTDNPEVQVTTFLSKFNAIFTLNQDTLLEAKYFGKLTKKENLSSQALIVQIMRTLTDLVLSNLWTHWRTEALLVGSIFINLTPISSSSSPIFSRTLNCMALPTSKSARAT